MGANYRFLQEIPGVTDDSCSQARWPTILTRTRDQSPEGGLWSRPKGNQLADLPRCEISLLGVGQSEARALDALAHLDQPRTILPVARFYLAQESRPAQVSFIFGRPCEADFEPLRKTRLNEATELVYLICPQRATDKKSLVLYHRESLIRVPVNVSAAQINSLVQALCPWAGGELGYWDDPLSFLSMLGGRVTEVEIIETLVHQAQPELEDFYRERSKAFVEAETLLIHITVSQENLDLIPRLEQVDAYDLLKRRKGLYLHQSFAVDPDLPNQDTVRLILIPS